MQWFRMWTDAMDDEKLKLLAFEDRWHYVVILCMKRKGILDVADSDAMRDRKVGAKLGLGDRERDEVKRRLLEVSLIDKSWQPLGWTKRQFVSDADPTATQRKQKQRDRERHGPVTRDSRTCHTAQRQITDTESDKKTPTESRVAKRDTAPTKQVFEHWQAVWNHPDAKLDAKRQKRIESCLKDFTPEQLCDSISGFRNSPWHCGTDPKGNGKVYDAISTLLRDTAQVEEGIRLLAAPPRGPPRQESASERILRTLEKNDNSRVIEHEPERTGTPAISRQ